MISPSTYFQGPLLVAVQALMRLDRAGIDAAIGARADLNQTGRSGMLPLAYLVAGQDRDVVGLALSYGADPLRTVEGRGTPLALAARFRDPTALKTFLEAGMDPNVPLAEPLIHTAGFASAYGNIFLLVAHGADINATTAAADTLLVSALFQGDMELALLALQLGCDPFKRNRFDVDAARLIREHWSLIRQNGNEQSTVGVAVADVTLALIGRGVRVSLEG